MKIKGIQHIGLPVSSMDKTVEFYSKMGFKIVYSTINKEKKVAFLKLKNIVIEAYETDAPALSTGAWNHICFDVDDIKNTWNEIVEVRGIQSIEGEIRKLPFWDSGVCFFTILGPNMERIEFAQVL